jgi:O-antigen/teichoic acid export membrane protein
MIPTTPAPAGGGVARGMAWTFSSAGAQAVLSIASVSVLARLLTPADFGIVAAALIVVNFSTIFSQVGVNQAVVQRRELTPGTPATAFLIAITLAAALSAALAFGATLLAGLLGIPASAEVLRALSALFVIRTLASTSEALMTRALRFRAIAVIEIGSFGLGYGAVGIAMALSGAGVWSLVGAHLAQATLKTLAILSVQRHGLVPDLAVAPSLLHFGGGHVVARIANFTALQADNIVVARALGAGALGVYSRAYQLMGMPAILVGAAMDRVLFPTMSRQQDDRDALRQTFLRGLGLLALSALPLGAAMWVLAPEVVGVLLGRQWLEVVVPFQILVVTLVFRLADRLNTVVASATASMYTRAALQALYALMVVLFAWWGLRAGVVGVATGVAVALCINGLLTTTMSLRIVGGRWREALAAVVVALPLTLLALSVTLGAAWWGREAGLGDLVTLVASVFATALFALLAVVSLPRLFLGRDALWIVEALASLLGRRFGPLARSLARRLTRGP